MTHFDIQNIQPRAWEILARSFEHKRTASTYLFHGPEGVGRWATAISFAALLNCEKLVDGPIFKPCGTCSNCRKILSLNSESLHFAFPLPPHKNLEEAAELTGQILEEKRNEPFKIISSTSSTNIPIDMARDIRSRLSLMGDVGVTRVVIFYEMEKMRLESADALLKLIEEPPRDTVIVIITGNQERLAQTIRSRAQKIKISRVQPEAGEDYLVRVHKLSENDAKLMMRLSDFSIGRAIEMSEQERDESSKRAIGLLLFKSLFDEPSYSVASHINDLVNTRDRGAADDLLFLWQSLMRDCINYSIAGDENKLVNLDFIKEIKRFSGRIPSGQAAGTMTVEIKNTLEGLRRNVHIQAAITALAFKLKENIIATAN